MSPGKVLVTGGAGFIGSHVCEAYLSDGWDVTALDNLSTGRATNVPSGVTLIEMDVRAPELHDVFCDGGFDVVNHHAAQIDVCKSVEQPRYDASINIDGLLNLVECSLAFEVRRFVLISSGGVVYGETMDLPIPRSAKKQPLSPYGISKLTSEYYLHAFRKLKGLEYAALRYANVYGPRQDPNGEAGVVAIFSQRIRDGEELIVFGDGEQTRDYVFVRDVALANVLATHVDLPEPTGIDDVAFNVGTGVESSVNVLASTLIEISGQEVLVKREKARPGELLRNALDCKETHALGWVPTHTMESGLTETYEFIAGKTS